MISGTLDDISGYLTNGFWGGAAQAWNLANEGGVLYYNVAGNDSDLDGLSAERQDLVRKAFATYEAVLGIDFEETTSSEIDDFTFSDESEGAWASTSTTDGWATHSWINVAAGWWGGGGPEDRNYTMQTIFHEIGHGLGLGHAGPYNGSADYDFDALYHNDSWAVSMMSYFSQWENWQTGADHAYLVGPMAADWMALEALYGGQVEHDAFAGDTVWGVGTNIVGPYENLAELAQTNAFCIKDDGGIDTVNFSNAIYDQTINLRMASEDSAWGSVSSVGGYLRGNMTLAVGTVIENATGGGGYDQLFGNEVANVLIGNAGGDTLMGGRGNDELRGNQGFDTLIGGRGLDLLVGGKDADVFDFNAAVESTSGACDIIQGFGFGDLIDINFGDLHFGGVFNKGAINLANVSGDTHVYVNLDRDATAEFELTIVDGSRKAGWYDAFDFEFV